MRISSGVAAASLEVEGVGVGGAVATESITDSSVVTIPGAFFFKFSKKVMRRLPTQATRVSVAGYQ